MIVYTGNSREVAARYLPDGQTVTMTSSSVANRFVNEHADDLWICSTYKDKFRLKALMWGFPIDLVEGFIDDGYDGDEFSDVFTKKDIVSLCIDELTDADLSSDLMTRLAQMCEMLETDKDGISTRIYFNLQYIHSKKKNLKSLVDEIRKE